MSQVFQVLAQVWWVLALVLVVGLAAVLAAVLAVWAQAAALVEVLDSELVLAEESVEVLEPGWDLK